MYIYAEDYSERALEGTTEFITKSRPRIGTFYIPSQNDARALRHQCLKGLCNESWQIYVFRGFDDSPVSTRIYFFWENGECPITFCSLAKWRF